MQKRHCSLSANKKGFTLIEMLVVIAIIAILATLVVAGFSKAKDHTNTTRTLSNLRQLYQANVMHALEYDGYYVPSVVGSNGWWLNSDEFGQFLQGDDHNGWTDFPSVYKAGSPRANQFHDSHPGFMSIGISHGWDRAWSSETLHVNQASMYPNIPMFVESSNWHVFGSNARSSPVKFDDKVGTKPDWGRIAFRNDGKAGLVTHSGQVRMVEYDDLFPRSDHPETWPSLNYRTFPGY